MIQVGDLVKIKRKLTNNPSFVWKESSNVIFKCVKSEGKKKNRLITIVNKDGTIKATVHYKWLIFIKRPKKSTSEFENLTLEEKIKEAMRLADKLVEKAERQLK